jgi:hypothetical protein
MAAASLHIGGRLLAEDADAGSQPSVSPLQCWNCWGLAERKREIARCLPFTRPRRPEAFPRGQGRQAARQGGRATSANHLGSCVQW